MTKEDSAVELEALRSTIDRMGRAAHDVNNMLLVALDGLTENRGEGVERARYAMALAVDLSRGMVAESVAEAPVSVVDFLYSHVTALSRTLEADVRLIIEGSDNVTAGPIAAPADVAFAVRILLLNAAAASPPTLPLRVAFAIEADRYELTVSDVGRGEIGDVERGMGASASASASKRGLRGAGLELLRRRLQRSSGSLRFERNEPRGLRAIVSWSRS
ncbi:MAG: hypothetical protein AAGA56_01905 [Myxococcota bacterium]